MKNLILLTLMLFGLFSSPSAHADLLERVRLEEALRSRIEQIVQVKDPKARVLTRLEFKTFEADLPGTTGLKEEYSPSKLESSDIMRANVEVYTELKDLPAETRDAIFKMIPVSRGNIRLNVKKIDVAEKEAPRKYLEAKDLSDIAQESVRSIETLSKTLLGAFAGLVVFSMIVIFVYSARKMREFKAQFALLANAISEGGGGRSQAMPAAQAYNPQSQSSNSSEKLLANLPLVALKELFADSYWCENDGYAHWLWRNLESEQRSDLLAQLPFMNDYSLFFVEVAPNEESHHDHPYYLNPSSCVHLSMDDVNVVLNKDLSVWHRMSPMRQARTTISLEQKLKAVQTRSDKSFDWKSKSESTARKLKVKASFGDISLNDELALFETPTLAPESMRGNIRSLVWLAQKPDEEIKKILTKYDARSLASAWVGAEPVLKKLEAHLPEKKLKLVQMYCERQAPSRSSSVYDSLVDEGLRDEAA